MRQQRFIALGSKLPINADYLLLMPGEAVARLASSFSCLYFHHAVFKIILSSFHPRCRILLTNRVGAFRLILEQHTRLHSWPHAPTPVKLLS